MSPQKSAALRRVRDDAERMDQLQLLVVTRLLSPAVSEMYRLADEIAESDGLSLQEARALVSALFAEGSDLVRTVIAGSAFARGVPLFDLATAWGYATPSGMTRHAPEIRRAAAAQQRADEEGRVVTVGRPPVDYGSQPGFNFVWEMHPGS